MFCFFFPPVEVCTVFVSMHVYASACTCMHMCGGERIALVRLPSSVHSIILIGFIRGLNLIPALRAALGSVCVCAHLCLMFTTHQISHWMFSMQQKWGDGLTQPYHSNKTSSPPVLQPGAAHFSSLRAEPQSIGEYRHLEVFKPNEAL